jgi:LysR family glycine cleavage system transcriptional activator
MTQRLPSLNALRAFEAAARHRSLTNAARELNVTPAAVSHQVKALEVDLGVQLLRRVKGEFVLSTLAEAALPGLRAGFDHIAEAARRLRGSAGDFLTISVGPTFASTWLVRRLGDFTEGFPGIEVRLHTTDALADFTRDGVDVAIRCGRGVYPGCESIRLFDEDMYPVCSPALLASGPPLETPADLAAHTLLHVDWRTVDDERWSETLDWEMWLRAGGATEVDHGRGPRLSHTSTALQMAADGRGVALASDSLAGDDLAAGRLVRLFDVALEIDFAYYLVYLRGTAEAPKIAAFRDWLLSRSTADSPSA